MTRTFPTEVILSMTTGKLLCSFDKMHEMAEFVAGHPIFTHQFADKQLVEKISKEIWRQHPQLEDCGDAAWVNGKTWETFRDYQILRFGAELPLSQME